MIFLLGLTPKKNKELHSRQGVKETTAPTTDDAGTLRTQYAHSAYIIELPILSKSLFLQILKLNLKTIYLKQDNISCQAYAHAQRA